MRSGPPSDKRPPPQPSEVALAAADWLVRLMDSDFDPEEPYPDPAQRRQAFFEWLNQSPEHIRKFMDVVEVERRTRNIDPQHHIQIEELLAASQQTVVSLANYLHPQRQPTPRSRPAQESPSPAPARFGSERKWKMSLGLAAAGVAALGIGLVYHPRPVTASSVYYSTAVGERQTITLDDGSIAILNAASRIAVTFDQHTREVRLLTGEAFFDVHHESSRPFRVIADDVFLEDIGTQFDVDRRSTATSVSVLRGSVQLTCGCVPLESAGTHGSRQLSINGPAHSSAVLTLTEGDQVTVHTAGNTLTRRELKADELSQVIGWKDGEIWFNGAPLSEIVEHLNRYSSQHIVVTDASMAEVEIEGMCKTTQATECAKVVADLADGDVLPSDPARPNTIELGRESIP